MQDIAHLKVQDADLAQMEQIVGGESLRGRTGGAVTLAVGMSRIFTSASASIVDPQYTGVARQILVSLRHHVRGAVHPHHHRHRHAHRPLPAAGNARPGDPAIRQDRLAARRGARHRAWSRSAGACWSPPARSTPSGRCSASPISCWRCWRLCLVTTLLINSGRGRYAPVTLLPMLFVTATTMTAGVIMVQQFRGARHGTG